MIELVMCQNNGVQAIMTRSHYRQLQIVLDSGGTLEDALSIGLRCFVFITHARALRSPELTIRVTATVEAAERWLEYALVIDRNFYVPLSNGIKHWESDRRFVGTFAKFMALVAAAYQPGGR